MGYTLDIARSEVSIGGVLHRLTPTQRTVLLVLLAGGGQPVRHEEIAYALEWPATMHNNRYVRQTVSHHVNRLRDVLGESSINTLPGAYVLNVSEAQRCPACGRVG